MLFYSPSHIANIIDVKPCSINQHNPATIILPPASGKITYNFKKAMLSARNKNVIVLNKLLLTFPTGSTPGK